MTTTDPVARAVQPSATMMTGSDARSSVHAALGFCSPPARIWPRSADTGHDGAEDFLVPLYVESELDLAAVEWSSADDLVEVEPIEGG